MGLGRFGLVFLLLGIGGQSYSNFLASTLDSRLTKVIVTAGVLVRTRTKSSGPPSEEPNCCKQKERTSTDESQAKTGYKLTLVSFPVRSN